MYVHTYISWFNILSLVRITWERVQKPFKLFIFNQMTCEKLGNSFNYVENM